MSSDPRFSARGQLKRSSPRPYHSRRIKPHGDPPNRRTRRCIPPRRPASACGQDQGAAPPPDQPRAVVLTPSSVWPYKTWRASSSSARLAPCRSGVETGSRTWTTHSTSGRPAGRAWLLLAWCLCSEVAEAAYVLHLVRVPGMRLRSIGLPCSRCHAPAGESVSAAVLYSCAL
jgi:hypothetical protein